MSKKIQQIYTVERYEDGYNPDNGHEYYTMITDSRWTTRIEAERRIDELVKMEGEDYDWVVAEYPLFQDYEQFERGFVVVEEQTDED